MTTLVGIAAGKGEPGVVLASDLTGTRTDWEGQGDIAVRVQTKEEVKKIHVDEKGELAVCMSGINDLAYKDFLFRLVHNQVDFKGVPKEGRFEELFKLNYNRFDGRLWSNEYQNCLLVATRFDGNPGLYSCWPLGKVEPRDFTSVGSGSKHVIEYVHSLNFLSTKELTIEDAVKIASDALKRASTDIYTGGLDIAVLTRDRIYEFGSIIQNDLDRARRNSLSTIIRRLKK